MQGLDQQERQVFRPLGLYVAVERPPGKFHQIWLSKTGVMSEQSAQGWTNAEPRTFREGSLDEAKFGCSPDDVGCKEAL